MPGFDPRIKTHSANQPYEFTILGGTATNEKSDVLTVLSTALTIKTTDNTFTATLTSGTGTLSGQAVDTTQYSTAAFTLTGNVTSGAVWTVILDGTKYERTVRAQRQPRHRRGSHCSRPSPIRIRRLSPATR